MEAGLFEAIAKSLQHEANQTDHPRFAPARQCSTEYFTNALRAIQRLLLGYDEAAAARGCRALAADIAPALWGALEGHVADKAHFCDLAQRTLSIVTTQLKVGEAAFTAELGKFKVLSQVMMEQFGGGKK